MQNIDWNDLRFLLAVQRGRTLTDAARRLGVDLTTVSRRLARLQDRLGRRLVDRTGDGGLTLTEAGEAVARQAALMERLAGLIDGSTDPDADRIAGTVRLTTVPIIANRILIPKLAGLLHRHPALQVEILPDSRDYSLTRHEADLALRLSRPKTGGTMVKASKVATLAYGVYAAAAYGEPDTLGWLTYDEAMAHVPQARWIARSQRGEHGGFSSLRVRDGDTLFQAVVAGLGKSLLPLAVADSDARLVRLDDTGDAGVLGRDAWLLGHADLLDQPPVRAVADWVTAVMRHPAKTDF
ncbi:MAG: LysR family transcriptional regulator [Alphaproteobacteria bacterium]